MPKCPNCGQKTARTGDWACQWCGYPLLSESYKRIPKTYRQLKEEKLYKQKPPVREDISEPAPELEPEPVAELEPEPVVELEPEPVMEPKPKPKRKPKPKPEPKSKPKPKRKSKPKPKPEPVAELEPEPVVEPEPEPVAEPEPAPAPAAIEITAEELLLAYEADGATADAKFANKILKVTGVVDRIEIKDVLGIYYITLTSAERTLLLQNVRCTFDKKYEPELNQLTSGQTVTVQGQYDGSIIDISMRDCVLVH